MALTRTWMETSRSKQAKAQRRKGATVREGIYMPPMHAMAEAHGWVWVPLKLVGQSETWHLNWGIIDKLGHDTFIARVSKHFIAVNQAGCRDTYDSRRCEYPEDEWPTSTRMVYGAWVPGDGHV